MLATRMLRTAVLPALVAVVASCSSFSNGGLESPAVSPTNELATNGSVVDSIRIGAPIDCPDTDPECVDRLTLAKEAVIERHRIDSTTIGAARFYLSYLAPGAEHGGGGGAIVVFDLEDGSQAAVLTVCFDGCHVVDPQPLAPLEIPPSTDHGPLIDPLVKEQVDCTSADYPSCNEAVSVAIAAATQSQIITVDTVATAHYYVTYMPLQQAESSAKEAEYVIDIYVAGEHDVLAEISVEVSCGLGPCEVVSATDTSLPPEEPPVPEP